MPKQKQMADLTGYALFFMGIVFLIETVVLAFVMGQLPGYLTPTVAAVVWLYVLIKFLAGVAATYAGLNQIRK